MKIKIYPADMTGCGWMRLLWPVEYLRDQLPADTVIEVRPPDQRDITVITDGRRVARVLDVDPDAIYVFQRLTHSLMAQTVPLLRAAGAAVVVDVDDDLSSIHPRNPAYDAMHPSRMGQWDPLRRQTRQHSWANLAQACRDATLVTVSTPALLERYAAHGRGRVLFNYLPEPYYTTPHEDSDVIGWPAALQSHPDDPSVTGGALARLVTEGASFRTGGPPAGVGAAFGMTADPAGLTDDDPGVHGWPQAVASLGIGIAPLADTRFNAAKCVDSSMRICTHRGVLEAGKIRPGDQVWRNGWKLVEAVEHDVPQPGFEITTEGGYVLRLTPEHRMLVNGEWTYAKDIAVSDTMAMEPEPIGPMDPVRAPWPAESRMSRRADADHYAFLTATDGPRIDLMSRWGRFLGAFIGDGNCGQATSIQISCDGQDQDWIDLLMSDLRAFGLSPTTEKITTYGGEVLRRRGVRVSSAHLLRVLNSFGLTMDRDNGRPIRVTRIPDVIWSSPREVIAEFLAAYFEADGSCTHTGVQVISKDEQLIRDVQRLLVLFGIVSSVRKKINRAQNGFVGTYWAAVLGRDAADVFARKIGFRSARKRARLAEITDRSHSNAFRPMNWTPKVTDVKPCMVTPVDLQVEGHEYMAAGFVSHNSWLKPLEMSALGVPWVASPRTEYERLHKKGAGVLADTPRRWYRELSRLMNDPGLRKDRAEQARAVADGLRLKDHAWRWLEAWTAAIS